MRDKDPETAIKKLKVFFSAVNGANICDKCSICCGTNQKPVVDIRNANLHSVDVLFISEAASEQDIQYTIPMVGLAGMLFRKALLEAGVKNYSVVMTNAVVCRPVEHSEMNRIPSIIELENCSERIKTFIDTLSPRKICLVGNVAKKFYKEKFKEWKVNIPTYHIVHPAYIVRLGSTLCPEYDKFVSILKEILEIEP